MYFYDDKAIEFGFVLALKDYSKAVEERGRDLGYLINFCLVKIGFVYQCRKESSSVIFCSDGKTINNLKLSIDMAESIFESQNSDCWTGAVALIVVFDSKEIGIIDIHSPTIVGFGKNEIILSNPYGKGEYDTLVQTIFSWENLFNSGRGDSKNIQRLGAETLINNNNKKLYIEVSKSLRNASIYYEYHHRIEPHVVVDFELISVDSEYLFYSVILITALGQGKFSLFLSPQRLALELKNHGVLSLNINCEVVLSYMLDFSKTCLEQGVVVVFDCN